MILFDACTQHTIFKYYNLTNIRIIIYFFRSYNSLFNTSNMTSNTENNGYDSDDFM